MKLKRSLYVYKLDQRFLGVIEARRGGPVYCHTGGERLKIGMVIVTSVSKNGNIIRCADCALRVNMIEESQIPVEIAA